MVRKMLDYAVNVATIVLAASAVWLVLGKGNGSLNGTAAPPRPSLYEAGDEIPSIEGVDFKAADKTLLVVMKSDCPYCTASSEFYRRLLDEREGHKKGVQILFVGTDIDQRFDQYLGENRLPTASIVRVSSGQLKIRGTPTILLVDKAQRVEKVWEGKVPPQIENEVVKVVFGKPAD